MAAFITAVVTAVQAAAAWIGSSFIAKTVFNIAASFLVSRLINKSANKSRSSQQGGRVQLPPQTNNRIPVVYGSAYVNGIITDARLISTDNKTNNVMYYCLVLSELTNTGVVGLDSVYWNDVKLVFEPADGSQHKVLKGVKTIDTVDDYEDLNFKDGSKNLVEIRVYAGNTESAQQIYPQSNKVNAYDYWPTDTDNKPYWNHADYGGKVGMAGLVFAIIRVEYNQEKGFTGLPNVTFKLNNTLNNPALVWYDYMTSNRYGANINTAEIDSTALAAWQAHCDEYYNTSTSQWQAGVIAGTRPRYQINGIIDTGNPVKNNIDQILQNSAAWMSYDISVGRWRVYPQAAQAPTLTFDDDNIVGGIELTSTNLEDLYNELEVEYCDTTNFDQRLFARDSIPAYDSANPAGTRHPNEPDNKLSMTLDLINNNVQALRVGRIQLKQTRDDLVIRFTASHVALQAQAGDVILVKNSLYNWNTGDYANGKPFRITRVKEMETQEGALVVEITALEYNEDVYTEEPVTLFEPSANIGIRPIVGIEQPTTPTIQTFESDIRPKILITNQVPDGIVEAMEFWISFDYALTESARSYKLIRVERPASGGVFQTGATISFEFDSLDSSNLVIKSRGINRQGFGPFSSTSLATTFIPKPVAGVLNVDTVLVDSSGAPVGDLTLPELLTKVSETFTAADGGKTLADKVFEEFTAKTGFDIVSKANDGSLGTLVTPEAVPNINPSITGFTPTSVDYLLGGEITLTGTKFSPQAQPWQTVTTVVLINGTVTTPVTVSDTEIKFVLPTRATYPYTNTIQVRVSIVNNQNNTTNTGTSGSISILSQLVEDLVVVGRCPATRNRSYLVSEQAVSYKPYLGSCFISFKFKNTDINEPLVKNVGTARIYRADGVLYDTVDQDDIEIYNNVIRLPFKDREPGTDYYILIDRGIAKTNGEGILTPALDKNNTTWTFTTDFYNLSSCDFDDLFPNSGWGELPPEPPLTNITPNAYRPYTPLGQEVLKGVVKNNTVSALAQNTSIRIAYLRQIQAGTGNLLVKDYVDDTIIIASIPVASGTFDTTNSWTFPKIDGVVPDKRYRIEIPNGFFKFIENQKIVGVSPSFNWIFKTYPLAELISYELDSAPRTDPNLEYVNRRSNIQLTFGRKVNYWTVNGDQPFEWTSGSSIVPLGIRDTMTAQSRVRLYRKVNDQLVEEIEFTKTFASDRVGVLYNLNNGKLTINFTYSFDCDTEYYLLTYNLLYDEYWEQSVGNQSDPTQIRWRTDGIKICHVGHDMDLTYGFFTIGFDRVVSPSYGVLRIIDDSTGEIINEIQANDWNLVEYNDMGTGGLVYDYIRDEQE